MGTRLPRSPLSLHPLSASPSRTGWASSVRTTSARSTSHPTSDSTTTVGAPTRPFRAKVGGSPSSECLSFSSRRSFLPPPLPPCFRRLPLFSFFLDSLDEKRTRQKGRRLLCRTGSLDKPVGYRIGQGQGANVAGGCCALSFRTDTNCS